ncbi:hypothetical protein U4E84_07050 [Halorubrum sp. AD140]|uniref:hypothetical protein n=1 Tax=Halorubrum sp. AD140 TaxID=3050073 RepID=UPI002ACC7AA7|nr:hypothetical protein [Halorubrum sp. AD140]MDZ5811101.1 hypothetical protein [Halorubrum sp. AD140]
MNWSAVPPAAAAVAAAAIAVSRRLPPLVLESGVSLPSPETISLYALGGRFVSFVLVYGLLFALAVAAGERRDPADGPGATVLATGLAAGVVYLVATAATLLVLDPRQGLVTVLGGVGSGVGVGVQLAVVAFAGIALGERRRRDET